MKVSLNWIREFLDFELPPVDELVEKIGAQLGAVEEVIDLGAKYRGIVIVKVVSCTKLENSDHLNFCLIDDGGKTPGVKRNADDFIEVVCGAPNVREGLLAAWLPPGSTVPSSFGTDEPFVLEARELRGIVSNGMLASPKELAIGDSHEGILELEGGSGQPGDDFAKTYKLDDYIIDIENKMFTHRPDLFGELGIAREIAGILGKPFTSPAWYADNTTIELQSDNRLPLAVRNEVPEIVPRFTAIAIANITVKPSPVWLQSYLTRAGIRPISNIVDLTNYYMLLTGQPLHAYDYDKVKTLDGTDAATLVIRNPHQGEKLTLLSGKEIEPRPEAILIATATQAIGLGGVMGGANTEVDAETENLILECATFDMYSIRRTSMANGIFTDAVTRFNKGQSPLQNTAVLARLIEDVLQLGGGKIGSQYIDDKHLEESVLVRQSLHEPVKVSVAFINDRLGFQLSAEQMKTLLENVEFTIETNGDELTVTAPFWRTDVELREDVVEEVGRLYGFDKLPLELPTRDLTPAAKDPLLELKANVRGKLSKAGANEVLTYSFVHGNLMDKTGQDKTQAFALSNALSPDLQYYRISLMPSLLDKVHANIKAGYDEFALFELGKTHSLDHVDDDEGLPKEFEFTALVVAANDKLRKAGAAYYEARTFLANLTGVELAFSPIGEDMQHYPVVQPYDLKRAALVSIKGGSFLGIIGEFKPSVGRQLKLPKYCAGFEIDTTVLAEAFRGRTGYTALPRFPKVTQDITLKVAGEVSYQDLSGFLKDELDKQRPENSWHTLDALSIYQREDDAAHKQLTFRLDIASYDRTLTDTEINALLDQVSKAAKAKYSAERV